MKSEFVLRELIVLVAIVLVAVIALPNSRVPREDLSYFKFNINPADYSNFLVGENSSCYVFYNNSKISPISEEHFKADVVGMSGSGSVEYSIQNPINLTGGVVKDIYLSLRMSPMKNRSLVVLKLNNKNLTKIVLMGKTNIMLKINESGIYLARVINANNKSLEYIMINNQSFNNLNSRVLRLNIDSIGGFSINKSSGDFMTIGFAYVPRSNRINRTTIAKIIMNPKEFTNKTVAITAKTNALLCNESLSVSMPSNLSENLTLIDDGTGCIYGNGNVLMQYPNKVLILAQVKLKNSTPYLSSNMLG